MRSLLFCALIGHFTNAGAGSFHDDRGFSLEISSSNHTCCVIAPAPSKPDPQCADVVAKAPPVPPGNDDNTVVGLALLRASDHVVIVTAARQPPAHEGGITDKAIDDYVAGAAEGLHDEAKAPVRVREQHGRRWERTSYGPVQAVRFVIEADTAAPAPQRFLSWLLFGEHGTYVLFLATDAAHESVARTVGEQALTTVRLPPLSPAHLRVAEHRTPYQQGYLVGFWVGRGLGIILLVALGRWIYRRWRGASPPA
jgi:hypothetical protein